MTLEEFDVLVGEISQRAFSSGWQAEIEMELWLITVGVREPRMGKSSVSANELRRLREHLATDTWISWSGQAVLVPLVQWLDEFDLCRVDPSKRWLFVRN